MTKSNMLSAFYDSMDQAYDPTIPAIGVILFIVTVPAIQSILQPSSEIKLSAQESENSMSGEEIYTNKGVIEPSDSSSLVAQHGEEQTLE
jgi:hypothetical protein